MELFFSQLLIESRLGSIRCSQDAWGLHRLRGGHWNRPHALPRQFGKSSDMEAHVMLAVACCISVAPTASAAADENLAKMSARTDSVERLIKGG
jgi:hypothetical protein